MDITKKKSWVFWIRWLQPLLRSRKLLRKIQWNYLTLPKVGSICLARKRLLSIPDTLAGYGFQRILEKLTSNTVSTDSIVCNLVACNRVGKYVCICFCPSRCKQYEAIEKQIEHGMSFKRVLKKYKDISCSFSTDQD